MNILDTVKGWVGSRKTAGAPNLAPSFFHGLSGNEVERVFSQPGQHHVWVYAACQAIIQPFIKQPVVLTSKSNEEKLIEDHPVLTLFEEPNPFMGGKNLWESILWGLLLYTTRTPGGQVFLVGNVPTNFRKGEVPDELWVFNDETMRPKVDKQGVIECWELTINGAAAGVKYQPEEVIRIRLLNPYNLLFGLSPLKAAQLEVSQDAKAKDYNSKFFENSASPGGMVSMSEPPSKEIWESIKKQFQQQYQGHQNAGKTMFMPWALKYEHIARSHLDFQFMEQLNWNQNAILAAYRINKWAIGDSKDLLNRANAAEARRQLFENVIMPYERLIMSAINRQWISHIKSGDLRAKLDFSGESALRNDMSEKIVSARQLVDLGVPPTAAFEFLEIDLDTSKFPWLKEDPRPSFDLGFGEPEIETPPEEPKILIPEIKITMDERDKIWPDMVEKVFNPGEKKLQSASIAFFNSQRNEVLTNLDEFRGDLLSVKVDHLLPSITKANRELLQRFGPLMVEQARRSIRRAASEIKILSTDSSEAEIRRFLASRFKKLSVINRTTFRGVEDKLAEVVASARAESLTVPATKKAIKEGLRSIYGARNSNAPVIARTETGVVTSMTRTQVFKDSGFGRHEWVTAGDERVRESHKKENGSIVDIGKRFPHTHLKHPSDPNGPADEVIQCRCVNIASEDE